ncbi:MAG: hypothetical protein IPL49_11170 [Saprospirales bacterium]|nr:hypothetical protein [Saprospirales bacterium]
MATTQSKPLTNLQLELLKIFSREVSDQDLLEIRKILAKYFAQKAMDIADQVWDANKWTEEDEQRFLHEHTRTTYQPE